jgi:transcriptional regulator with XRE-family HTH domain
MLDHKHLEQVGAQVAAIMRAEREKRGLSMNAVAERSGLSQPMISLVERRMRKPTLDTLLRMGVALEIDLVDVLQRAQRAAARAEDK